MQIEVREAVEAEHGRIGDLTVAAYRTIDPDLGRYQARIRDVAGRTARATVLVALLDGAVAGTATYVGDSRSPMAESQEPQDAGIRMLAVDPPAMGNGIGTRLVERCIELARADAKRRVVLLSRTEMVAAQGIYRRLGFTRAPELDEVVPGATLLGFALDL
jgi:ribosomal protein S18 acetylase RimI-like enzyme